MVSWRGLRAKRCKTRGPHAPAAPPKPPTWSPPPGTRPRDTGPRGRGRCRVGERSHLPRVKGAHWHQGHLQSAFFPCASRQLSPHPTIQTPAFPQSPLPHQSTKTSPSLGLREKAGRPPGLGRSTQSRLGTEQDALGKETIWSLKEPQGTDPRPWELAQARHRHLQRTAGRSQRPVSRGPGAAELTSHPRTT